MAASELLIMPSYLESLSMVALEAWAMGKPVLANAKCDVLQGQCIRSNAGLFYGNYAEFAETMRAIDTTPSLQAALGRNGRVFFEKHYAWPVIEKKYVDMLQQLSKESAPRPMEPAPGWFARRRRSQPPADDVVKKLPAGPYREERAATSPAIGCQLSAGASPARPGRNRARISRRAAIAATGATPEALDRRVRRQGTNPSRELKAGSREPRADRQKPEASSVRNPSTLRQAQGRRRSGRTATGHGRKETGSVIRAAAVRIAAAAGPAAAAEAARARPQMTQMAQTQA